MGNALDNLQDHFRKIYRLSHLAAMGQWDQAAMMPPGGNQARSEALAELAVIIHREKTHPQVGEWLDQAGSGALDADSKASLREMRRVWQQATVIPEALVQAKSLSGSACEHAWRTQRKENDWQGFAVNLETVVKLSREEAQIREGNLQGVFDWLRNSIWQQGSRLETDALILSATGEALNPAYFRQHLEQRYLKGA